MTFPVITLRVANEILKPIGVQVTGHFLGYYEAQVGSVLHSHKQLGVLMDELMTTYFKIPEREFTPLTEVIPEVEPDFDEWQYLAEKRHTDAGIL